MLNILLPYFVFLFLGGMLEYLGMAQGLSYLVKTVVTLGVIVYFWKSYRFSFKWSWYGLAAGLVIFLLWIGLEGLYPIYGTGSAFVPTSILYTVFRVIGAVLAAAIVEELFTRGLLMRYIINKDWTKVAHGTFTWPSFIVTVLFFGLSHDRWLAGILSGIIFNLVWYKEKSLEPCIIAHSVANLALAIYVITTGQYYFW